MGFSMTHWKNTSAELVKVSLFVGAGQRPLEETWAPGETKSLPSEYDLAFTHKSGGVAPQLKRVDPAAPETSAAVSVADSDPEPMKRQQQRGR